MLKPHLPQRHSCGQIISVIPILCTARRSALAVLSSVFVLVTAVTGFSAPPPDDSQLPDHVRRFGPVPTSRVKGSPEPPPPFLVERIYPERNLNGLITAKFEPGTGRLIFVERVKGGGTRVQRASVDLNSTNAVTLLETNQTTYSIEFHPGYRTNGFLYTGSKTHWQKRPNQMAQIMRHTISRKPPHEIVPGSEKLIIEWPSNGHDGLAMAFAKDGLMFVTTGDGTSDSDDDNNGQRMDLLHAKVLRIDVDNVKDGETYSVPKDNPFVHLPNARPETWAIGFRNPWRAEVDRKTGHLWVTQNGQDTTEQVYLVKRGENYGWSVFEGSRPFRQERKLGPAPHTLPTAEHGHGEARSLTGGIVYHGKKHKLLQGAYLYADYATGKIWAIRHDGERVLWHQEIADTTLGITGFLEDKDGELLVFDYQTKGDTGFYRMFPNPLKKWPQPFPRKLSETGLFASVKKHRMKPEVIPYDVNAPNWSDGLIKTRYVALPAGTTNGVTFSKRRGWDFPESTVVIQSFALEMEEGKPESRRWIETRFLTKLQGEWVGYSYRWNDEQTDATLVAKEGLDKTLTSKAKDGTSRQQPWHYPSRAECMICHTRASKYTLGLSAPQMDREFDYGHGFRANQIKFWNSLGLFARPVREATYTVPKPKRGERPKEETPEESAVKRAAFLRTPTFTETERLTDPADESYDLDRRARSYLQANCAICHVEAGGGNSQFNIEFYTAIDKTKLVNGDPVHGLLYLKQGKLIVPGRPDQSVLWQRIGWRGPGQMPPLGTAMVDPLAVSLLGKWIRKMK